MVADGVRVTIERNQGPATERNIRPVMFGKDLAMESVDDCYRRDNKTGLLWRFASIIIATCKEPRAGYGSPISDVLFSFK